MVEHADANGNCFLIAFGGFEDKALRRQKDVMGIHAVGGTVEAACVFEWIICNA